MKSLLRYKVLAGDLCKQLGTMSGEKLNTVTYFFTSLIFTSKFIVFLIHTHNIRKSLYTEYLCE